MAKLYYRSMVEDNGQPKVGRSARLLGVRPGIDIDVEQMPRDYLDDQGYLRIMPRTTNAIRAVRRRIGKNSGSLEES